MCVVMKISSRGRAMRLVREKGGETERERKGRFVFTVTPLKSSPFFSLSFSLAPPRLFRLAICHRLGCLTAEMLADLSRASTWSVSSWASLMIRSWRAASWSSRLPPPALEPLEPDTYREDPLRVACSQVEKKKEGDAETDRSHDKKKIALRDAQRARA